MGCKTCTQQLKAPHLASMKTEGKIHAKQTKCFKYRKQAKRGVMKEMAYKMEKEMSKQCSKRKLGLACNHVKHRISRDRGIL